MKVKRSGYVYRIYRRNILNLWVIALALVVIFAAMLSSSGNYLLNYLIYRSEPDQELLTEFLAQDILDIDEVCADIAANGGEEALDRASTSMFYKDNVYQEGGRYRFSVSLDPSLLTDTGIYYDEEYQAYLGIWDPSEVNSVIPREHYATEHLYLYDYNGYRMVLAITYDLDTQKGDSMRVTFAPIGVYSLYMVQDLQDAGIDGEICNYLVDCRETPVDFEDEDFKDIVIVFPFMLLALIPSILLTVCPVWHPTYRQLAKYARTPQKAADMVDANYEEYGIITEEKKTLFLEDWVSSRSLFKTGIQRNYRKQYK